MTKYISISTNYCYKLFHAKSTILWSLTTSYTGTETKVPAKQYKFRFHYLLAEWKVHPITY